MKLKVVRTFADYKILHKMYAVGEIIDLPDDRASKAIKLGLAEEIAEAKAEEEKKPTKNTKRTKKCSTK